MEAFIEAKKAGKLRFIGFTGHKDPRVHQRIRMIEDYRLTFPPVLKLDFRAVFGCNGAHIFLIVVPFTWFCFDRSGLS